jgi:hypothetical protein
MTTTLHREVRRLTDALVDSLLVALRRATFGELVSLAEPPRVKAQSVLVRSQASLRTSRGKFIMTLPDGKVWKANRKRDLVRRAKQQGLDVIFVT